VESRCGGGGGLRQGKGAEHARVFPSMSVFAPLRQQTKMTYPAKGTHCSGLLL
jgi:hypothetical protein